MNGPLVAWPGEDDGGTSCRCWRQFGHKVRLVLLSYCVMGEPPSGGAAEDESDYAASAVRN
jgi:hypothetical protein